MAHRVTIADPLTDIACPGFDKSTIPSYSNYKLVITTVRELCPDASVG
jgi:hypothetical protein